MRYLMYTSDRNPPTPPTPELMAELGKLMEDATKANALVMTGGFGFTTKKVRSSGGKITVVDGPYAEAKELVGGYAIFDVRSEDEAVEWATRFRSIVGDGESTVQRLWAPEEGFPR